jgi:hypothetical protein
MFGLEKEFAGLVNCVFALLTQQEIKTKNRLLKAFIRTVQPSILSIDQPRQILKADIHQQLALLWISFKKDFDLKKPDISFKRYMVMRSAWGIRDWLNKELVEPVLDLPDNSEEIELSMILNTNFLFYGTQEYPFASLNTYQRYLLFLRFYKDMNYNEIAELTHRTPQTIRLKIEEIITTLRSYYDQQEDASRSRV